uniref:Orf118 n=1 Tax=Phoenix dactylifera TaxID=42345 RepID=A0A2R4FZI4_PHODC|nr:orf118 [Phoenix dactylifera]
MGRTRGDHPENLRLLGGIWRLTQHNRRAEPTPNHYSHETRGRDVLEANTKITAQPPLEGTPAPQLSKMEQIRLRTREMRERREKKREGSAETQVPLPELPEPEVEVEGLLSEKKRQMIWTSCRAGGAGSLQGRLGQ